jgi:hypothetical protein
MRRAARNGRIVAVFHCPVMKMAPVPWEASIVRGRRKENPGPNQFTDL